MVKQRSAGIVSLLAAMALTGTAHAAVYKPTRFDDPVPGDCRAANCSLREALKASNASPETDTINLKAGTYELALPNDGAGMDNGSLDFVDGVEIRGAGPGATTIDANDLDQVITGWNNGSSDAFDLRDLTLTGGEADAGFQNDGGAILIAQDDQVSLRRVHATDNRAPTSGGAISALERTRLKLRDSVLTGNIATFGGGIEFRGAELFVQRSTIAANLADEGGGLDVRPGPVTPVARIRSSTIGDNQSVNKAGGILVDGLPYSGPDPAENPDVSIRNSTISLNRASNDAGGLMADNLAKVDVENSSIGYNRANFDSMGTAVAGGVYQHSNADFSIDDSVIAHNDVVGVTGDEDCSATQVFSGAGNAISKQTGCSVSFTEPFNTYSNDTIAQPPADNGGPTQTLRVPGASIAVGLANQCPKHDQRGKLRPANCDSGAYENKPKKPG